jgi:biotin operon repressor
MSLENIPKDPVMLMSFMNMKLRDKYSSLEVLADDLDISESELKEIVEKLKSAGFDYNSSRNQFV